MTIVDFQKILLDTEHKINNNHDEVNKRLDEFQMKLEGQANNIKNQADNIKNLQDTTNQIEIKIENQHVQKEVDLRESLTLLKLPCKKMNCTPTQLLQENQEHISSDSTKSTDSHEKVESSKKSVTTHQEVSNTTLTNKQL